MAVQYVCDRCDSEIDGQPNRHPAAVTNDPGLDIDELDELEAHPYTAHLCDDCDGGVVYA